MNKVTTINLNGNAYQLEESGYDALRDYLETAAQRLEGNPDKAEIIADIEQAIADKFRAGLGAHKTVVVTNEVENVIAEMGPVQDASPETDTPSAASAGGRESGDRAGSGAAKSAGAAGEGASAAKRLYTIKEGAMIGGVCNGLAAYLNLDVTVVRIAFVLLAVVTGGLVVVAYLVMMALIPPANTSAEKAAAYGAAPFTAQEFIRRARAGFYEGRKTFSDKHARREWKRKFKHEMRGWDRDFAREIRENSHQWRGHWHQYWGQNAWSSSGASFVMPLLWLVRAAILLAGVCAMISLLSSGAIFGVVLPAGLPVWVGLIGIFFTCHLVAWPFKALRHSYYYHGRYGHGPRHWGPGAGLGDLIVWGVFVVVVVCLADRYMPQVHEALKNLPPVIHQAVDSIQQWWDKKVA